MTRRSPAAPRRSLAEAQAAVERFLHSSRQPVLQEPGEEHFPLTPETFSVEVRVDSLVVSAWDEKRNLVRRVVGVGQESAGRLELEVEKLGRKRGKIELLDLARPGAGVHQRKGERLVFCERFRRFVRRAFPGWRLAELTTGTDLHHGFSPNYPRALVARGGTAWAAAGAAPDDSQPEAALSFGLIWLDYLRRRERRVTIEGLALFLPQEGVTRTVLRLRWLNPRAARYDIFVYSREGYADRLDPADWGNLETRLERCRVPSSEPQWQPDEAAARVLALPGVEKVEAGDGAVSLRVRGLEFARLTDGRLEFGLDRPTVAVPSHLGEIQSFVRELSRLRAPGASDKLNPLYQRSPEAWLESQVRAGLERIDPNLTPAPVYGQVPAFAGGARGILDLLAADLNGRLAVLELKASQDLHLPLQALDYWMRVAWHARRADFTRLGYFPGVALRPEPPRLLLIAPALEFHPTTETVLRYFSPEIEVERIGIALEWRHRLRVMFRLRGAARPS